MKSAIPSMLLVIMSITILTTSISAYAQNGNVAGVGTSANENGAVSSSEFVSATDAVAPDGTWFRFQFSGIGSFGTSGPGGATYSGAPNPPWTFDCPDSELICWLKVTDGFLLGDEFEIFDFGSSVGTTSAVVTDEGTDCLDDPDACLAGGWSSAMIDLGPGAHSITIQSTDSPFGGGGAFFKVEIHSPSVGGEFEGVNTAALLVAGAQVNAYWILPVIAAISIVGVLARKRF